MADDSIPREPAAPTLPPPVAAMLAQAHAIRMQLEALELSLEAFGHGLLASQARAQQAAERAARDAAGRTTPGPVFGHPVLVESAPSTEDVASALSKL